MMIKMCLGMLDLMVLLCTIGKFDPNTGAITVYKMPDPAAQDPHTAIFDHQGMQRVGHFRFRFPVFSPFGTKCKD